MVQEFVVRRNLGGTVPLRSITTTTSSHRTGASPHVDHAVHLSVPPSSTSLTKPINATATPVHLRDASLSCSRLLKLFRGTCSTALVASCSNAVLFSGVHTHRFLFTRGKSLVNIGVLALVSNTSTRAVGTIRSALRTRHFVHVDT